MDTVVDRRAPGERAGLQALPADLHLNILRRVSEASRGYSHALVCKDWAALAPSAQLACACTCKGADGEDGVEAAELARELLRFRNLTSLDITAKALPESFSRALSQFPNLTSLDVTAEALPESFLSSYVPESLKHLCLKGQVAHPWDLTEVQGLPRLKSLETLCVLDYLVPCDAWPLSASLQHLDLGGVCDRVPSTRKASGEIFRPMEHCRRGWAALPRGLLERIQELRELRVFRANLWKEVELPESMSQLTNLEELNLYTSNLESLFSGIGQCQKLRRLLICTGKRFNLPTSLTQLSTLSFMYLCAPHGVRAPPGMDALSSLHTLDISTCWSSSGDDGANTLLAIPSLQRLHTTSLPRDMSMLTSLKELAYYGIYAYSPYCPESMWSLKNIRTLIVEGKLLAAIPKSVKGLSSLEEIQVLGCPLIQYLPGSLTELPRLKKLILADNPKLRSLPISIGSWPSLQTLYLKDLPQLRIPKALLSELRLLDDLTIQNCNELRNMLV